MMRLLRLAVQWRLAKLFFRLSEGSLELAARLHARGARILKKALESSDA